jgi:predicted  nucleic acid-binding Zn-ribbon protein
MAGPAAILREIHRLRRHAKDLQLEIERAPRLVKAQQGRVSSQEDALRDAQDKLKKLKVTYHEKELELKTTLQHIDKHERQLNEAGSKKEYDALKVEIASDKKKCQQLEDEILNSLTQTDEVTAQLPELEQARTRARVDYADYEKSSAERVTSLSQRLEETIKAIGDVEASLPGDMRSQYNRLITARGEDALAAVQNQTCMACYTEITAQNSNDLSLGQFVCCKSCGRALYLPE